MKREEALELLKEHVKENRIFKHSLAVEGAMIAYAKKFGEDEKRFGLIGLLHDIDFEKYPEVHPAKAPELLATCNFDNDFIDTILSHGIDSHVKRDTMERKCLHGVDEMASFIIAVGLMRPTKLEGLKGKSVKKKMKDKAFAKAVNREEMINAMENMEVEFNDHIDTIVEGLIEHEKRIGVTFC